MNLAVVLLSSLPQPSPPPPPPSAAIKRVTVKTSGLDSPQHSFAVINLDVFEAGTNDTFACIKGTADGMFALAGSLGAVEAAWGYGATMMAAPMESNQRL